MPILSILSEKVLREKVELGRLPRNTLQKRRGSSEHYLRRKSSFSEDRTVARKQD